MSRRRKDTRGNPATSQSKDAGAQKPRVKRTASDTQSNPYLLVYALLGVTLFMFIYLHLYALPQMTYFAGGFSMPDTRITGYGYQDIERLRNVMDDTGTGQLNFLHKTAGIIFPVGFFLSAWAVVGLIMRRGIFRWIVLGFAFIFAVSDIVENFIIDRILTMSDLDERLVQTASTMTVAGWILLVLVGATLVSSVVMDLLRRSVERTA